MSCFADSNIWLYALPCTPDDARNSHARDLIRRPGLTISTQVINEVCTNLKRKKNVPESDLADIMRRFLRDCDVSPVTMDSMLKASNLRERYSLSFYDSQIAACALLAGCNVLESEDMQAGLVIEGVLMIRNPFESA
jgi:predicted nucleic acid-binding protein